MTRKTALAAGLALVAASVAISLWAYPHVPARVPSHWDVAGNVNGYSPRWLAMTLVPAIAAFVWFLMLVLPAISPRGFRLDRSASAFYESVLAIVATLVLLHAVVARAQAAGATPPLAAGLILIGALFVVLGNLMGKLQKNFFIGIRTPWTLASDEVWLKTNRLTGRLMVACGLAIAISSFVPAVTVGALIATVVALIAVPAIYSYVLYRRTEGFGPNGT